MPAIALCVLAVLAALAPAATPASGSAGDGKPAATRPPRLTSVEEGGLPPCPSAPPSPPRPAPPPAPDCAPITLDSVWSAAHGPRRVDCRLAVVGATLELEPGARVEFGPGAGLRLGRGAALDARGLPWAPVVLSGVPGSGPGSWEGLVFDPGSRATDSRLDQVHVLGAGAAGGAALSWAAQPPRLGVLLVSGGAGDALHGPEDRPAPSLGGLLAHGLGGVPACAPAAGGGE